MRTFVWNFTRWAACALAISSSFSKAFFTSPLGRSASFWRDRYSARSQNAVRSRVTVVQTPTGGRTLKTRTCAVASESFSTEADYDRFLGELVFSQADVKDDVLKNLDKAADEGFMVWLREKVDACEDLEERVGLKSLLEIVEKVKAAVDDAIAAEEAERAKTEAAKNAAEQAVDAEVIETKRTNAQVWEEMRRLQRLGSEAISAEGSGDALERMRQARMSPFEGLPEKVRSGYEKLLEKLVDRSSGQSLQDAVEKNYEQCDVQFLTLLNQKAAESQGTEQARLFSDVSNAVNAVMQRRMAQASEKLQTILSAGSPAQMEETIGAMASRGEVDDALVLLLQANLQQAESAGAKPAAEVLRKLSVAAQQAADDKAEPEKRLLRQLLRADARDDRIEILQRSFRQKGKVVLADGSETDAAPEVTPPKFIEVVKNVIRNFGNVGEAEVAFADKLDDIISEAEEVATDLYGESQTPQDQQDRAWKDTTVSVFDLENMEEEGKLRGEEMPWANDQYDGMSPEMVKNFKRNDKGDIQIGGS